MTAEEKLKYELMERRDARNQGYEIYFNGWEFLLPDSCPQYLKTYKRALTWLKNT